MLLENKILSIYWKLYSRILKQFRYLYATKFNEIFRIFLLSQYTRDDFSDGLVALTGNIVPPFWAEKNQNSVNLCNANTDVYNE